MPKHCRKQHDCPNCGTSLAPAFEFCPTCGQENHELKVPFRHMVYEFVEGITHFDAKVWHTLRAMYTPGRITAEFLVGKRARYVPPVRLYIFVSIVFFVLLNALMGQRMRGSGESTGTGPHVPDTAHAVAWTRADTAPQGALEFTFFLPPGDQERLAARVDDLTNEQLDSVLMTMGNDPGFLKRRLLVALLHVPQSDEAEDYISHQVTRSLSWLMFLLMPFTALLLKLFFARRRLYYEHLIFSIHTHTAVFLLLSLACGLGLMIHGTAQEWIVQVVIVAAAVYMLVALRRVYRRSWAATMALSAVLVVPYFIAFLVLALAGLLFGFLLH